METQKLNKEQIARTLKGPAYRDSLSEARHTQLPGDAVGPVALDDAGLDAATGGLTRPLSRYCGSR